MYSHGMSLPSVIHTGVNITLANKHGSHIYSYENNCLLTSHVDNMVQLLHYFIKIAVSFHGIKTLYLLH